MNSPDILDNYNMTASPFVNFNNSSGSNIYDTENILFGQTVGLASIEQYLR